MKFTLKNAFILLASLCLHSLTAQTSLPQLLDELYAINHCSDCRIPTLEITNGGGFGAQYVPKEHKILVEQKALDVTRSFKEDSLKAMAFLLGHELTHSFQEELKESDTTNFLAYNVPAHVTRRAEKQCDIQGAFSAYLAGYDPRDILPEFIERLYEAYGLNGKDLYGYPSKADRQYAGRTAMVTTNQLIVAFEAANLLTLLGEYPSARECLLHAREFYQGKEMDNNLGVINLLEALNFPEYNIDLYVYPIEIDTESRLMKPKRPEGAKDLTMEEKLKRNRLLEKAKALFESGIMKDPDYIPAQLNLVTTLLLWDHPERAMQLIKTMGYRDDISDDPRYELLRGIGYARMNTNASRAQAADVFNGLAKSGSDMSAKRAAYNLGILMGADPEYDRVGQNAASEVVGDEVEFTIKEKDFFTVGKKEQIKISGKTENNLYASEVRLPQSIIRFQMKHMEEGPDTVVNGPNQFNFVHDKDKKSLTFERYDAWYHINYSIEEHDW